MEHSTTAKRRNPIYTMIDVTIVLVHLAIVAMVIDWLIVASLNLNFFGMAVVGVPTIALIVWVTVKLWQMSVRNDALEQLAE